MRCLVLNGVYSIAFALAMVLWCSGCGRTGDVTDGSPPAAEGDREHLAGDGHDHSEDGHDHSGWWCNEHGIPEAECSMCNSKVAAEFQRKGDWCQEHDRAKSQCFVCDPQAKEKYAAMYRAKYGHEPPAIESEEEPTPDDRS